MKLRDMWPFSLGRRGSDVSLVNSAGTQVTITNLNPDQLREFMQGGALSSAGVHVTDHVAFSMSVFWRAVHLKTAVMASLPIDLIEKSGGERKEVENDPILDLLTWQPNQWQTPFEFRRMLEGHKMLRGRAYAYKVRGVGGKTIGLIPLNPDRVRTTQKPDLRLSHEYTTDRGERRVYDQDEVLFLLGFSFDGVNGMSVVQYARNAFGIALQAEKAGATIFKQGTLTGWALKHPGKLSEQAKRNIAADMFDDGGVVKANTPPIFEEGMEPVDLGMTAEDMEFLATRKFQRSEIAIFTGVPLFLLGDTENVPGWASKGIEHVNRQFAQYGLQEDVSIWEGALARAFETPRNRRWRLRLEGLLRGDFAARVTGYHWALNDGWLNPNEVRSMEDRNGYEGGDTYRVPSNTEPNHPALPGADDKEDGGGAGEKNDDAGGERGRNSRGKRT